MMSHVHPMLHVESNHSLWLFSKVYFQFTLSSFSDERYRVRLLLHPGVSGSDYINASYIDVS